jgi:uncharacterized lipoprotein YajG
VVTSNHDLVFEGQYLQVFDEIEEVLLTTISGEVASMDEDISFDILFENVLELFSRGVSIGNSDDSDVTVHGILNQIIILF